MKITNTELLQAVIPLQRLIAERLPIKVAYNLSRIIRLANKELADFNAAREKLIIDMGEKQDDGSTKVPEEKEKEFFSELDKLGPIEVELNCKPIPLSAFNENVQITTADMMLLEKFIEVPTDA